MRLLSPAIFFAVTFLSGFGQHSSTIIDSKVTEKTFIAPNQAIDEQEIRNDETDCLSTEYPKRKYIISAGVLNIKAIDIPKPQYPVKAKARKIAGDVKASVFVDEAGNVVWARVNNGHPILQEAVKRVVCQARFKPAAISGNPYSVSGFIIYRFVLPKR